MKNKYNLGLIHNVQFSDCNIVYGSPNFIRQDLVGRNTKTLGKILVENLSRREHQILSDQYSQIKSNLGFLRVLVFLPA